MAPVRAARRLDAHAAEVRRPRERVPARARWDVRRLDVRRGRLGTDSAFKFYQFVLFVISLWILQVVLKFWRYLSAVDPARARILASPRRRHAASQAAHNERAVRRLESGASD